MTFFFTRLHVEYYQLLPREIINMLMVDPNKESMNVYSLSSKMFKMCTDPSNLKWHLEIEPVTLTCQNQAFKIPKEVEEKHEKTKLQYQHHYQGIPGELSDISFYSSIVMEKETKIKTLLVTYKQQPDFPVPYAFIPDECWPEIEEKVTNLRKSTEIDQVFCCDTCIVFK